MHDLVIVGGGPAGATCARRAALNGLDVLLVEREVHPRPKLCGGALTHRVADLVDFNFSHVVQAESSGGRLYSHSGECLELSRSDYIGYLVNRPDLDTLLIQKAKEAGAEVLEGTKVLAVEQLRSGVRVLTHGDSHRAHLLVGADGVNGVVAKQMRIRDKWSPESVGLCIAADFQLDPDEVFRVMALTDSKSMGIDLHLGILTWGYGWCFPKKDILNIGIGCRVDHASNLRGHWNPFVKRVESLKGVKLSTSERSAFRIPLGGAMARYVARRTILVGDAAGLVSPVTGEGVYYAMKSGMIAADVASEAAEMKQPQHVLSYEKRLRESILSELRAARNIAKILFKSKKNMSIVFRIAEKDPVMREYIIDFVTGTQPLPQVRKKMTRRMLSRHPMMALRLRL
ncbi:MAG: geranylgeranyl reductase family protein [Candidatus Thorarchaeota archaeon]